MNTIICYDIPDNKRRLKISNILEDFGDRVQESVFEAELDSKKIEQLCRSVEKNIDIKEDDVRIYIICLECKKRAIYLGKAKPFEIKEFYII